MALIHCPECKIEVSNKAQSCPKCAYPLSRLTSLPEAILKKDPELVEDLLKSGADVNELTTNENTPLHLAAAVGNTNIIQTLLTAGAIPQAKNQAGETALDVARKKRRKHAITLLQSLLPQTTLERPQQTEEDGVIRIIKKTPNGDQVIRDFRSNTTDATASLSCTRCAQPINGSDLTCPHCKILIVRRYCGRCKKLYPDHAPSCPHCGSSAESGFRYHRHPEAYLTAVIALIIFSIAVAMNWDQSAEKHRVKAQSTVAQDLRTSAPIQAKVETLEPKSVPKYEGNQQEIKPPQREQTVTRSANESVVTEPQPPAEPKVEKPDLRIVPQKHEDVAPAPHPSETVMKEPEFEPPNKETVESDTSIGREEPSAQQDDEPAAPQFNRRARALNDLGYRLLRSGQPERAIPVLYNAVRAFPRGTKDVHYAYALFNLGRSLRLAGRPDLAIPILEERLKISDQRQVVFAELEAAKRDLAYTEEQLWTE